MRVLLLGGAGLIGSSLARLFVDAGDDVTVVDSYHFSYSPTFSPLHSKRLRYRFDTLLAGVEVRRCDIGEKRLLQQIVDEVAPHCIVQLAAIPLVEVATRHIEAASASLSEGLINVLEIVRASREVHRFVYVSSSMVYGHFPHDRVAEDTPARPLNIYGGLKLSGEVLTRAYLYPTNVEPVIVRPSAVYGPSDLHNRVVQKFCEAALDGEPILLSAVNDHTMDFTYVDDIARGLYLAATKPAAAGETFNVTYGDGRPLSDLAMLLQRYSPGIRLSDEAIVDSDRPRRGALCVDKARDLLGYDPRWPLERGIAAYIDHLRAERMSVTLAA